MKSLWESLDRRERALLGACLYLGALFVSCVVMWWMILVGGNPFTVENVGVVNHAGAQVGQFRPGEVVGIRRRLCANHSVGVSFYPALKDTHGFLFPLPGGLIQVGRGCIESTYGFIVPDLPPGQYTYTSTIQYQTNLVGRDENTTFPPLQITVTR